MADEILTKGTDLTQPNLLQKADKFLGGNTALGKLGTSIQNFRLGGRLKKGGGKTLPNFDIAFEGDKDYRVKIRVPQEYFWSPAVHYDMALQLQGAIVFPYTPTISQDYSASYSTFSPTHSNYAMHFYTNTTPGPISVSGRFSVQSNGDAYHWLETTHILRALTKMRFGADRDAGAPPPICRFDAYGDMQYKNVPVVIQSFKVELADNIDYYATNLDENGIPSPGLSKGTMVPTVSTITINLLPMYSREELLGQKQVEDYIGGTPNLRQQGFL